MNRLRRALTPDEAAERLVGLAREAPAEHLSPREAAGLHRLERALLAGIPWGRTRIWTTWVAAGSLVAASVAALVGRERILTFEVTNATVNDGGYVAAAVSDASVRFSDHSELGVEHGTRLRVSRLEAHGAHVMLEGGLLHVRIHPEAKTSWTLDAGPYAVHVTGTEFDLGWRVEDQTLDLRLFKGSVVVDGPLASGGLKIAAGQHLVAHASDGSLSIVDGRDVKNIPGEAPALGPASAAAPPASSGSAAPTEAAVVAGPAPAAAVERGSRVSPPRGGEGWGARVARGDFGAVIGDAERRGLEVSLADASVADLAALSDAARYARRPELARRALTTTRARFPTAIQARDAAFFLGGLAEAEKNDGRAIDWYDTYLREGPEGAYASQALGRKMVLLERSRGIESARLIAIQYLQRFGDGPYAPAARKLLQVQ
jgi:FecR-like protein